MDDKKKELLNAAMQVFSEYGYHNAKISKIAEIANIGAGSVYLHFKSKEKILEELFYTAWSAINEKCNTLVSSKLKVIQKLEELIITVVNLVENNKDLAILILHEYRFWNSGPSKKVNEVTDSVKEQIKAIIDSGINNGEIKKGINSDFAVAFFIGSIWHILGYWADNKENISLTVVKEKLISLIFTGIK